MKQLVTVIVLLATSLFVSNVNACEGGNQCDPYDLIGEVGIYSQIDTSGLGLGDADGLGDYVDSTAYTISEGSSLNESFVNLTNDGAKDCTECGDNRIGFRIQGIQFTAAGAQNNSTTTDGPALSQSETSTWSGVSGLGFGGIKSINNSQ